MNISIAKEEVKTVRFADIKYGGLFLDPDLDDSPLYIKTAEGHSICLLTGDRAKFANGFGVTDVTDRFVIVNL